MKNDREIRRSRTKVAVGLIWAEIGYFDHILKDMLRLIRKSNLKSIEPKMTILASKQPHKWSYLNSFFFSNFSVTQRLITSETIFGFVFAKKNGKNLSEMGSKMFGGLNQKFGSICISGI